MPENNDRGHEVATHIGTLKNLTEALSASDYRGDPDRGFLQLQAAGEDSDT